MRDDRRTYQIGNAQFPHHTDPLFETEQEAIEAARHACMGDSVYAVWHWEQDRPVTLYLVYQGDVWKQA
jgi:hypothetical protein